MNQQKDLFLLKRIRSYNDPIAKEELVKKYLPMIRHIIKIQNIPIIDCEDCFQEGAIALLKAINEYDSEKYFIKFSTFAYICILRRIYNIIKQSFTKKAQFYKKTISLNSSIYEDDPRTVLDLVANNSLEPFLRIEEDWIKQKIDRVLFTYLSSVEYQVVQMILHDYSLSDIQRQLKLSLKVIDNARTRARLKLKKVLFRYGSLLNPEIPMKTRKRKDLAIRLEVS